MPELRRRTRCSAASVVIALSGDLGFSLFVVIAPPFAAVLDRASGELTQKRLVGPPAKALEFLETLAPGVRAVYEAGPTGFGLARAAS